jgi:acyl-CoA synthetase (AMP-forming)/AMP-acid ligase II
MASGDLTVGSYLATAAQRFGDREAFYCAPTDRRFTFRETNARCNRLAHALLKLGLKKGDCVAFLATNRAEIVEIYFALAKTGLVGMPLNYRLAPVEVVSLMQEVDAVALLFEDKFAEIAALVHKEMSSVRVQIAFGESEGGRGTGVEDYEALLAGAPEVEPNIEVCESDPYYFNLTSGTTGMPKCYVLAPV